MKSVSFLTLSLIACAMLITSCAVQPVIVQSTPKKEIKYTARVDSVIIDTTILMIRPVDSSKMTQIINDVKLMMELEKFTFISRKGHSIIDPFFLVFKCKMQNNSDKETSFKKFDFKVYLDGFECHNYNQIFDPEKFYFDDIDYMKKKYEKLYYNTFGSFLNGIEVECAQTLRIYYTKLMDVKTIKINCEFDDEKFSLDFNVSKENVKVWKKTKM